MDDVAMEYNAMRVIRRCAAAGLILAVLYCPLAAADGASLYKSNCGSCHDAPVERVPGRQVLQGLSPEQVLAAMENGPMISMAARLPGTDRRAIAEFVTGKSFGRALDTTPPQAAMCAKQVGAPKGSVAGAAWTGWGNGLGNARFQSARAADLTAQQVRRLKVRWAFGFPGEVNAPAQPTVASGHVFVGSIGGKVYSLNAATGCVQWWFQAATTVRTAVSVGRIAMASGSQMAAFFGDATGSAYAVDASNGTLLWKTKADSYPAARITGSPAFHAGRLFVPVSSIEETLGGTGDYECCRFRGSVVALDGATGKVLWKTYTITEEPRRTKKNARGTQQWGPSGAAIWSAPTIDTRRNVLYVTTGDNYSDPPTDTSDAFIAIDMSSGKLLWSRQMTGGDAYIVACRLPVKTNCPEANGPDFDFGSSPILVSLPNGRRALIAGQKSGMVHAIDPDRGGETLWQIRVGRGGALGGVQWGSAADRTAVYVALSDVNRIVIPTITATELNPKGGGGMFALRLVDGQQIWHAPPSQCGDRKRCSPAQSAAVTAIPGVAFSGSMDGHLRAYSATDGSILWDFDTVGEYKTVNGVPAHGGSLDGPGAAISSGMLFVSSGYAQWGGMPGNVLLALSVDGK
jgi:polyvinyl alcohol dehydrogenase (cytochrome)